MIMLRRVVLLPVTTTSAMTLVLALASAPGAHAAPGAYTTPARLAGPQAAAAPMRAAYPVRGLDISSYQHTRKPIDWRMLARHGISFVAVKATEGTYYRNPYYRSDVRAAAAAGLVVMPYVFANPASAGGAPPAADGGGGARGGGRVGPSGAPPPGSRGRRAPRALRRLGRRRSAQSARARQAAARRRPGKRPVPGGPRLLRPVGQASHRLDRRLRRPGQGVDREVAGHLYDCRVVEGVHRRHQSVPRGPAVAGGVRRHQAHRAVHLAALDVLAVQQRRPHTGDRPGRPGLLPADR